MAAIPARVVDDLIIRGSTAEIRTSIERYLKAGIDTVFLSLSTFETNPARRRKILLDAMHALAPAAG